MRLNFSCLRPELIREGITRLALSLKEAVHLGKALAAR